jgi:hypothetical protein
VTGNWEGIGMNRSLTAALTALALAAVASAAAPRAASAQGVAQCNDFVKLSEDAKAKAALVQAGGQKHIDRAAMCAVVTRFTAAETLVVKFLEDNKTWCGIPDAAITASKANHEKTLKFRDTVCAEGPAKPKPPTLSDAIGTPTLDTAKNTQTGKNAGTFDTLTGNPLAK